MQIVRERFFIICSIFCQSVTEYTSCNTRSKKSANAQHSSKRVNLKNYCEQKRTFCLHISDRNYRMTIRPYICEKREFPQRESYTSHTFMASGANSFGSASLLIHVCVLISLYNFLMCFLKEFSKAAPYCIAEIHSFMKYVIANS